MGRGISPSLPLVAITLALTMANITIGRDQIRAMMHVLEDQLCVTLFSIHWPNPEQRNHFARQIRYLRDVLEVVNPPSLYDLLEWLHQRFVHQEMHVLAELMGYPIASHRGQQIIQQGFRARLMLQRLHLADPYLNGDEYLRCTHIRICY